MLRQLIHIDETPQNIEKINRITGRRATKLAEAKDDLFYRYEILSAQNPMRPMMKLLTDLDAHGIRYKVGRAN